MNRRAFKISQDVVNKRDIVTNFKSIEVEWGQRGLKNSRSVSEVGVMAPWASAFLDLRGPTETNWDCDVETNSFSLPSFLFNVKEKAEKGAIQRLTSEILSDSVETKFDLSYIVER